MPAHDPPPDLVCPSRLTPGGCRPDGLTYGPDPDRYGVRPDPQPSQDALERKNASQRARYQADPGYRKRMRERNDLRVKIHEAAT